MAGKNAANDMKMIDGKWKNSEGIQLALVESSGIYEQDDDDRRSRITVGRTLVLELMITFSSLPGVAAGQAREHVQVGAVLAHRVLRKVEVDGRVRRLHHAPHRPLQVRQLQLKTIDPVASSVVA